MRDSDKMCPCSFSNRLPDRKSMNWSSEITSWLFTRQEVFCVKINVPYHVGKSYTHKAPGYR